MYPDLFHFGGATLHSFGLMAALGFLAAWLMMRLLARRGRAGGLDEDAISQLLVMLMIGAACGARFAYVAEHWSSQYSKAPFLEVFRFDKGGLMFYGGLIGAILMIAVFCWRKRLHLVDVLDLCAAVLPLGHAFGRFGCFLNGCCHGHVTQSAFSVCYPKGSIAWYEQVHEGLIPTTASRSLPVLPSQPVEAVANLLLFIVLYRIARKGAPRGFISGLYLVGYAVIRFLTEMMRGDERMAVGPFSISQFISLIAFIAGICFLLYSRWSKAAKAE